MWYNINMKKIIYSTKKGFSIAETLLASFVLIVGAIAIVQLAAKNITQTANSRDTIIASQLAQEGAELVRNARDNSAGVRYLDKQKDMPLTSVFRGFSNGSCGLDYSAFYNSASGLTCSSKYDLAENADGMYKSSAGSNSNFKRRVVLTSIGGGNAWSAVSLVTWGNNSVPNSKNDCSVNTNCVYVESKLTKWIAVD